ncbi:hypothetical protein ACFYZO_24735, partial [Streptomyces sp. NPDC001820]
GVRLGRPGIARNTWLRRLRPAQVVGLAHPGLARSLRLRLSLARSLWLGSPGIAGSVRRARLRTARGVRMGRLGLLRQVGPGRIRPHLSLVRRVGLGRAARRYSGQRRGSGKLTRRAAPARPRAPAQRAAR